MLSAYKARFLSTTQYTLIFLQNEWNYELLSVATAQHLFFPIIATFSLSQTIIFSDVKEYLKLEYQHIQIISTFVKLKFRKSQKDLK